MADSLVGVLVFSPWDCLTALFLTGRWCSSFTYFSGGGCGGFSSWSASVCCFELARGAFLFLFSPSYVCVCVMVCLCVSFLTVCVDWFSN